MDTILYCFGGLSFTWDGESQEMNASAVLRIRFVCILNYPESIVELTAAYCLPDSVLV